MNTGFRDVKSDAWYAQAVSWAAENGIVTGYSDTVFAPDDKVTREQLAAILHRWAGSSSAGEEALVKIVLAMFGTIDPNSFYGEKIDVPFDDAASVSEWAVSGVNWAWDAGVLNGKTEKLLAPQENATRAEVATMFLRVAAIIDG